jgi:hypothetical protein
MGLVAVSALFIFLTAPSVAPQAATVEGVTFAEIIKAGDTDLKLRGTGLLRYMVFIKVYGTPRAGSSAGASSSWPAPSCGGSGTAGSGWSPTTF